MSDQSSTLLSDAPAAGLLRTRYFPRQLLNSGDLNLDLEYFIEKLRRQNRLFQESEPL